MMDHLNKYLHFEKLDHAPLRESVPYTFDKLTYICEFVHFCIFVVSEMPRNRCQFVATGDIDFVAFQKPQIIIRVTFKESCLKFITHTLCGVDYGNVFYKGGCGFELEEAIV